MSGRLSYIFLSIKKISFDLRSISLPLHLSLVEFRLLAQAVGILMLVPRSMFNDHVVTIQPHYPSPDVTLTIEYVFNQLSTLLSTRSLNGLLPRYVLFFFHKGDDRKYFRFGYFISVLLKTSFAPVGDRSQHCLSVPLLFLMKYARDRYHRCIRIQHVHSFFSWQPSTGASHSFLFIL